MAQKLRAECCTNEAMQYLRECLVINSTTQLFKLSVEEDLYNAKLVLTASM